MVGLVLVTVCFGGSLAVDGFTAHGGPPAPSTDARPPGPDSAAPMAPASAAGEPRPAPPMAASPPVRIAIPMVRIEAPVGTVGLNADGTIAAPPPDNPNLAAWYTGSPTPGALGTAVVVGHVDATGGRAVFYDIATLRKGTTIRVARQDGTTAVFTVYGIQVFKKAGFPVERVYGGTGFAELRILTCGGTYDKKQGYTGNVVVFARLTGEGPTGQNMHT